MTGVTNVEAGRDNIGDFINLYVRNYWFSDSLKDIELLITKVYWNYVPASNPFWLCPHDLVGSEYILMRFMYMWNETLLKIFFQLYSNLGGKLLIYR